jgi:hypothetical protein
MLYICVKGFKSLVTCENIWLWMLVLHQCLHVVFPFHFTLVKKMIFAMIKKKLWTYICHLILHLQQLWLQVLIFGCPKV